MKIYDVWFALALESGRIVWYIDPSEHVRRGLSNAVTIAQGHNLVSDAALKEWSSILNEAAAIGVETTWGPDRAIITARDGASVARYGLFQDAIQPAGVVEAATANCETQHRNAIVGHRNR